MTIPNAVSVPDRSTRLVVNVCRHSQLYNYQHWTFWESGRPSKAQLQGGILRYWKKRKLLSNADYIILASCGFSIERPYDVLGAQK